MLLCLLRSQGWRAPPLTHLRVLTSETGCVPDCVLLSAQ